MPRWINIRMTAFLSQGLLKKRKAKQKKAKQNTDLERLRSLWPRPDRDRGPVSASLAVPSRGGGWGVGGPPLTTPSPGLLTLGQISVVSRFHNPKKHTQCPSGWSVLQTLREFKLTRRGGFSAVRAVMFGGAWESRRTRQSGVRRTAWWILPPGEGQGTGVSPAHCWQAGACALPLDLPMVGIHLYDLLAGRPPPDGWLGGSQLPEGDLPMQDAACCPSLRPSSGELRTVALTLGPAEAHQLLEDTPSLSICFASWPGVPTLHDHSRPHVLEITLHRLALRWLQLATLPCGNGTGPTAYRPL